MSQQLDDLRRLHEERGLAFETLAGWLERGGPMAAEVRRAYELLDQEVSALRARYPGQLEPAAATMSGFVSMTKGALVGRPGMADAALELYRECLVDLGGDVSPEALLEASGMTVDDALDALRDLSQDMSGRPLDPVAYAEEYSARERALQDRHGKLTYFSRPQVYSIEGQTMAVAPWAMFDGWPLVMPATGYVSLTYMPAAGGSRGAVQTVLRYQDDVLHVLRQRGLEVKEGRDPVFHYVVREVPDEAKEDLWRAVLALREARPPGEARPPADGSPPAAKEADRVAELLGRLEGRLRDEEPSVVRLQLLRERTRAHELASHPATAKQLVTVLARLLRGKPRKLRPVEEGVDPHVFLAFLQESAEDLDLPRREEDRRLEVRFLPLELILAVEAPFEGRTQCALLALRVQGTCTCGREVKARARLAGKRVKCPDCRAGLRLSELPAWDAPQRPMPALGKAVAALSGSLHRARPDGARWDERRCACGRPPLRGQLLCVTCGFDYRGERTLRLSDPVPDPSDPRRARSSRDGAGHCVVLAPPRTADRRLAVDVLDMILELPRAQITRRLKQPMTVLRGCERAHAEEVVRALRRLGFGARVGQPPGVLVDESACRKASRALTALGLGSVEP
jgi:hypothetical protein